MGKIEPDFTSFADLSVTMVGVFFILLSLLVVVASAEKRIRKAIKTEYLPIYVGEREVKGKSVVLVDSRGAEVLTDDLLKGFFKNTSLKTPHFLVRGVTGNMRGDLFCVGFYPERRKRKKPGLQEAEEVIRLIKRRWQVKDPTTWRIFVVVTEKGGVNLASKIMKAALEADFQVSISFHHPGWYYVYSCALEATIPVLSF